MVYYTDPHKTPIKLSDRIDRAAKTNWRIVENSGVIYGDVHAPVLKVFPYGKDVARTFVQTR